MSVSASHNIALGNPEINVRNVDMIEVHSYLLIYKGCSDYR
jgi:hypothetical protein